MSPAGPLSYVPFSVRLPSVSVCYLPSATTWRLLAGQGGAAGEGVLALEDPDYRRAGTASGAPAPGRGARTLPALPATREEAKAVGTVTLLGPEATEAGLRKALAGRARWRAVHLACHGVVDPERPRLSSLALTPSAEDDGRLSCLDVFGMRIPADLVVLSACETACGTVVRGEGIVGLTRAFMFAGAPRVLCSLWPVEDEATRALMLAFYDLWSPKDGAPGLPAAEALRRAQARVRESAEHPEWRHPWYWAAWVLWGLPR